MIILHGYLLEGSGSNLWTRAILKTLCRLGDTIHVMCQEPHPEHYDFISEAWRYPKTTEKPELWYQAETPYLGKCILHKPELGAVLPVYVHDKYEEYDHVVPMAELDDASIEEYITLNYHALHYIVEQYSIPVVHVNHTVR